MPSPRVKISVSLPRELVARVDRAARAGARSRSRVLEEWLRRASRQGVERDLEEATAAYYESLTPEESREDEALAHALSSAARRLRIDDPPLRPARRRG